MKTFTIATALALAVPAFAQTVSDLPQCAQQPILLAIQASGCGLTDIPCICGNQNFVSGLLKTIPTVCTPAEVAVVSGFSVRLCGAAGVTLSLPSDAVSATAISAPSTLISSTGASTPASTPASITTTKTVVSTSTPLHNSTTTTVTHSNSTVTSASLTTSTSVRLSSTSTRAPSTTSSAGAGAFQTVGFAGLVGALALGVVGL